MRVQTLTLYSPACVSRKILRLCPWPLQTHVNIEPLPTPPDGDAERDSKPDAKPDVEPDAVADGCADSKPDAKPDVEPDDGANIEVQRWLQSWRVLRHHGVAGHVRDLLPGPLQQSCKRVHQGGREQYHSVRHVSRGSVYEFVRLHCVRVVLSGHLW